MKKLALIILGIIIGFIIAYLYFKPNNIMSEETPEITAPSGLITPAEARTLDQAYNSRHKLISDSIVKRPDNRSSWYSIEELEAYIAYAKKQAGELGYTLDGLRLYEGAYPDSNGQVGYTTMFFIPTGTRNLSEGSTSPVSTTTGGGDIPGGDGLNGGGEGDPPSANYPQ